MTKECKVLLNNDAVTVVEFDSIKVQMPSIHKNAETIFVKFEDGKYSVVDSLSNTEDKPKKKATKKKTTVKKETKAKNENDA